MTNQVRELSYGMNVQNKVRVVFEDFAEFSYGHCIQKSKWPEVEGQVDRWFTDPHATAVSYHFSELSEVLRNHLDIT